METTTTTPAATLPPGVTEVGAAAPAAPAATAPVTQPATAPVTEFNEGGNVSHSGNWDLYKICTGILLVTVGLMAIYYFRERTFAATADSKEKERKLNELNSKVVNIEKAIAA